MSVLIVSDAAKTGYAISISTATTTITAITPYDNTIPQNTEGTQIVTLTYTPKSANSTLEIMAGCTGGSSSLTAAITMSLFQDSGVNAIAATCINVPSSSSKQFALPTIVVNVANTSLASKTFNLRVGVSVASNFFLNQAASATPLMGGSIVGTYIRVLELM